MPHLDLFTVKVAMLLTMSTVSLAIFLSLRTVRQVAGMQLFASGLLSLSFGAIVGVSRLWIAGLGVPIACQIFMLGGMVAIVQGLRAFRGFASLPRAPIGGIGSVCSVLFLYWLFARDDFPARVALLSCVYSLLCVDGCVTLARRVPARDRQIYWPTACAFALASVNYAMRAASVISGHYGGAFLTAGPVEVYFTIFSLAAYVAACFGILLAANARAREESERKALYDPLTNLPNRRQLFDRFAVIEDHGDAPAEPVGLIYVDLDGFKDVNDFLGHAAGDELLLDISRAMNRALRADDSLARIGGDEFVVLVERPGTRAELEAVAERLQSAVANQPVCEGLPWRIRASCGMALYPDDGHSMHDVMREADAAMYAAKRRKRMGAAMAS